MDKEDVVHIYNGILLSHKKQTNNAICNNMDGPRDSQTEWSKSDRERQTSYANAYMWGLKRGGGANEFIDKREVESQTQQTNRVTRGWLGGIYRETQNDIYKLLYIKQVTRACCIAQETLLNTLNDLLGKRILKKKKSGYMYMYN